jgi:hypothetical protein
LADRGVALETSVEICQREGLWELRAFAKLTPRESALLFGNDPLVSWPTDDMVVSDSRLPVARGCMFLSEIAGRTDGLVMAFTNEESARRVAQIVRHQFGRWEPGVAPALES